MTSRSDAAAELRKALEDPIYNKTLRREVGKGELDYEVYLRTRELLSLQTPADQLVVPDELVFQVMHQTQELWLKCAAFETANLVEFLDAEQPFPALAALERIVAITRVLGEQIRVLFTLTPSRFQIVRRSLGNGSGLESPGYNQLLAAADSAQRALQRMHVRAATTLVDVYLHPEQFPALHLIAERFVDWDSAFQSWLVEHFMLVRRTIGIDKTVRALDGFPTVALASRMTKPLFPELWNVRVELTRGWSREGGFAVGTERVPRVEDNERVTREVEPVSLASVIREEFPVLAKCVYLNSSSAGATPRAAKGVFADYWQTLENWRDEAWGPWMTALDDHANEIAALIGAPPGSVVCDTNVATLFGRLLSCFDYDKRPGIVTTDREFPSLPFVIEAFRRYGATPITVASPDTIAIDPLAVAAAIDERAQLVCISHATFATGALLDVRPIVERAHAVGALVVLDAYQSIGVVPVNVGALDVDVVLGGSHKWLCGSYENAFIYVRPALLQRLQPATTGWIASADPLSFMLQRELAPTARRLASGTPAVLPSLFSRPGLDLITRIGVLPIREISLALTDQIIARADAANLTVATPRPHTQRGGIVTLRFPNDAEVARALIKSDFVCSHRGGIRVSPHFYNTAVEIDRFMTELVRLVRG